MGGRGGWIGLVPVALVAVVLALTSCSTGVAGPATASTTAAEVHGPVGDEEWLLYESQQYKVMLVNVDGTGSFSPSAAAPRTQTNPTWDPTGTRIAFTASDDGSDDLWTVNADGSDAAMMLDCSAPCAWIDDPAWSPDGSRIAFSRAAMDGDAAAFTLEIVDVATGDTEVVLGPWRTQQTAGAAWSPDSSRLAFELLTLPEPSIDVDPTAVVLTVVALDDPTTLQQITDPERFAETADWSPDGRELVFGYRVDPSSEATDLYTVSPDGADPVRLTTFADAGGYATHPAYTSDGSRVYFTGQENSTSSSGILALTVGDGSVGPAIPSAALPGYHPKPRPAR